MKKLLLTLTAVAASALTMYGQGRVFFNNSVSGNLISIHPTLNAAGEGAAGANVGGNYSIQLLWAPQGTYASEAAFLAASVGSSPAFTFFGTTGDNGSGAGFFDAGTIPTPVGTSLPAGTYTMMARAWYNNGTFATYASAGGHNQGFVMFTQNAPAFPTQTPNTTFPAFTVGIVPEPSTFALAGLGAAALLLFRRRK